MKSLNTVYRHVILMTSRTAACTANCPSLLGDGLCVYFSPFTSGPPYSGEQSWFLLLYVCVRVRVLFVVFFPSLLKSSHLFIATGVISDEGHDSQASVLRSRRLAEQLLLLIARLSCFFLFFCCFFSLCFPLCLSLSISLSPSLHLIPIRSALAFTSCRRV